MNRRSNLVRLVDLLLDGMELHHETARFLREHLILHPEDGRARELAARLKQHAIHVRTELRR